MPYFLGRVARIGAVLVALSAVIFVGSELGPGDFLAEMRLDPTISSETVERLRARYGLDDPLPVRYLRWTASVARGELGYSFEHGRPVAPLLLPRVRNTLLLTATATFFAWWLGLILGLCSAWRQNGWFDRATLLLGAALLALPEILLVLLGLLVAAEVPALPLGGMTSAAGSMADGSAAPWARLLDLGRHMVVPVAVLVAAGLPALVRHVRAAAVEAAEHPAVQAALGHGIEGWRLLWGYVLPSAANPLISLFGFSFGALLSGSMLVEAVLGWPGIGPLLLHAVVARDLHVILAVALASCLFLMVGNLLADLALRALDPRIRES